jgi:hypothetical protein
MSFADVEERPDYFLSSDDIAGDSVLEPGYEETNVRSPYYLYCLLVNDNDAFFDLVLLPKVM